LEGGSSLVHKGILLGLGDGIGFGFHFIYVDYFEIGVGITESYCVGFLVGFDLGC
jgi:hypothetical protein